VKGNEGNIGLITLNRQQALNALNHNMFLMLYEHLTQWQMSDNIKAVVIRATSGRAFSAGGDIRSAHEMKMKNDPNLSRFFTDEYKVNKLIFHYSKPYIALLDGMTMGGGVGVSIHGSYRIATEHMSFAMPETTIGFYPDVGASYFLSRLPHEIGIYLGLTGVKISYDDCYALGMVNAVVSHHSQEQLMTKLVDTKIENNAAVKSIVNPWCVPVPKSSLLNHQHEIQACFSKDTVEEIINTLEVYNNDWCKKTAEILKKKSPTSLKVTLKELRKGKNLEFDACMKMEACITHHMLDSHDFFEGIRATIIDKDQSPHWKPKTLEAVKDHEFDSYFEEKYPLFKV
jgi:enoyl-CoA hydratase/carnithine racemase